MRKRKISVSVAAFMTAAVFAFAGLPAYAEPPSVARPIDMSTFVDEAVNTSINRLGSNIKKDGESNASALFSASMATEWFAVRTVLYGVEGIDSAVNKLESSKTKYNTQVANVYLTTLLNSFTGDQLNKESGGQTVRDRLKQAVDGWSGENPDELFNKLGPLVQEAYQVDAKELAGLYGSGANQGHVDSAESIQKLQSEYRRLESIVKTAAQIRDVPGLDASEGSLYDRMFMIGSVFVVLGLLMKIGYTMYCYTVGKYEESAVNDIVRFIVIACFLIIMDDVVVYGIAFVDSIKNMIVGGDAAEHYELLRSTLELRAEYANATGSQSLFNIDATGAVASVCSLLAQAVVYILLILADIMMAITILAGPLVTALSFLPSFADYLSKWLKAVVTFLFYPIAAAIYTVLMIAIITVNIETSSVTLIIISVCYLLGALKIPNIAEAMNGAVLASVAATIASAPLKAGGAALTGGASVAGGGAVGLAKKAFSGPAT